MQKQAPPPQGPHPQQQHRHPQLQPHDQHKQHRQVFVPQRAAWPTKTPPMQRRMLQHPLSGQRSALTPLSVNLSMMGMRTPQSLCLPPPLHTETTAAAAAWPRFQPQPPQLLPLPPPLPQRSGGEGFAPSVATTSPIVPFSSEQYRASQAMPRVGGDDDSRTRQRRKCGAKRSVGPNGGAAERECRQGQRAPKIRAMDLRIRLDDDAAAGGGEECASALGETRHVEMLAWRLPARDVALDERLQQVYADAARLLRDHAAHHRAALDLHRQRATSRWLGGLTEAERQTYVNRNETPEGTKET